MVLSSGAPLSAENFYRFFQAETQEIQKQIEELSSPETASILRKSITDACLAKITRLAADVADAASDIPSYDQRSYNETIKSFQDRLAQTQALHAPKSKFSFKSKRSTPTPPIATDGQRALPDHITSNLGLNIDSVSSSRSVTPVHLQTPDRERTGNTPVPIDPLPAFRTGVGRLLDHTEENSPETATRTSLQNIDSSNSQSSGTSLNITDHINSTVVRSLLASAPLSICTVSNLSSSYLLMPASSSKFASLTLTSSTSSLLAFLTPLDGPAHITGIRNSVIVLHCRQFRMHHCENVDVYLFSSSRPIIEACQGIRFAKLPMTVKKMIDTARHSIETDTSKNMFDQVDDFKWLRAEQSPNWSLMNGADEVGEDVWTEILQPVHEDQDDADPEKVLRKIKLK